MKDIVIVTAYWRPDYILHCLEALKRARGIENKEIWIYQDNRIRLGAKRRKLWQETEEKLFFGIKYMSGQTTWIQRSPHDFDMHGTDELHPCSYNTFWALRDALDAYNAGLGWDDASDNLVYYVADDVIVTPDFFEWHEAVQKDSYCFSSVAERAFKQFQPEPMPHDLKAYYRAPTNLMDGGMCWRVPNLIQLIEYPSMEVRDHRFPPTVPDPFRRPMIPYVQRAYHVGRNSSAAYDQDFHECGDTDPILTPSLMPNYQMEGVYRADKD